MDYTLFVFDDVTFDINASKGRATYYIFKDVNVLINFLITINKDTQCYIVFNNISRKADNILSYIADNITAHVKEIDELNNLIKNTSKKYLNTKEIEHRINNLNSYISQSMNSLVKTFNED